MVHCIITLVHFWVQIIERLVGCFFKQTNIKNKKIWIHIDGPIPVDSMIQFPIRLNSFITYFMRMHICVIFYLFSSS